MRIVIDTNVLVSSIINPAGPPGLIAGLILDDRLTACYDSRILSEYEDVLNRPKLHLDRTCVCRFLDYIHQYGHPTIAVPYDADLPDASDRPFAETALGASAAYLITGNLRHFPRRIGVTNVVAPGVFLREFLKE